MIGSDMLVSKDYPLVGIKDKYLRYKLLMKNIRLAELSIKLADKLGKNIMLIVQGWDLNSYLYCAMTYMNLGVKYIGIGSLVPHKSDPKFTIKIVKEIRSAIGNNVWIHLFGIAGWTIINKMKSYINSVDTSTPMRAASNREIIFYDGKFRRIKISSFDGYFVIREKLNNTSDEIEYQLLKNIIRSKDFITQRKYLALYNAYTMLKTYNQSMQ